MIKICFLCNWGESSTQLLSRYKLLTPRNLGIWGDLIGVDSIAEADYYIIMEGPPEIHKGKLDPKKKIYFQREPHYIKPNKYYEHDEALHKFVYSNSYHLVDWRIGRTYDELKELGMASKTSRLLTITTGKRISEGHKLRVDFIRKFDKKYPGAMDIYGRGLGKVIDKKYDAIKDYQYCLACDNGQIQNYFAPALYDCFLALTMPIYWGCPNLEEFFPIESYRMINIRDDKAIDELNDIINQPLSKNNVDALKNAKDLILDKYNLWPSVERAITEGDLSCHK